MKKGPTLIQKRNQVAIQPASVPGLPANIVVKRSTRRRKSVSASVENGVTVVVIPQRMTNAQARDYALELHERITKRRAKKAQRTDADLETRALGLRQRYLPNNPLPTSVTWSARQQQRWGSCTPADGTIRISERLKTMPDFVLDYVLIHELVHLVVNDHGADFEALVSQYSEYEKARAYLSGFEAGQAQEHRPA